MTGTYIILEQHQIPSKYGGLVWELILARLEDRKEFVTYVDPDMSNYRHWKYMIQNNHRAYVITNCRILKKNILSADSRPKILFEGQNKEAAFEQILDIWRSA